ncbi:hypothetical protein [Priestia megaterium]|uniref:hypothetical protein n=1 Tax=Priestia megaterium TaxID=1404 RepID=UPI002E20BCD6|nr:hypothetical protein [Priestia megaterium]
MKNKLFFTEEAVNGNSKYQQNGIYEISEDQEFLKQRYIAEGKAVPLDFPKLETLEYTIGSLMDRYKKDKEHFETSPRYNDMPSERAYQLEQLEERLEADVAKTVEDYKLEIAVLEKEIAQEAVKTTFKTDEQTVQFLNNAVAQLAYSGNVEGDLELLKIKLNALSDESKATVLSKFAEIKQAVNNAGGNERTEAILTDILKLAKHASGTGEIDLKLRQLQALKGYNIDTPYKTMKIARKANQGGGI